LEHFASDVLTVAAQDVPTAVGCANRAALDVSVVRSVIWVLVGETPRARREVSVPTGSVSTAAGSISFPGGKDRKTRGDVLVPAGVPDEKRDVVSIPSRDVFAGALSI
jgi:hypothetical protein